MAERRSVSSTQAPQPRDSIDSSNPDVFSDDHALEPLESADSQQIKSAEPDGNDDVASLPQVSETTRRSLSFQRAFESPRGSFRRSGGSQRSDGLNSIASRSDDHGLQTSGPPRSVASISDLGTSSLTPHRSIRSISTFGFPRAQSPYQGATGPSHPYGMYHQDIGVARTPSAVTTSTTRQAERSYSGPNGPTQPYAMYPQTTVPEDDPDAVAGIPLPIAAGFPGLGQNYQRRLGPDGEDVDDLIGPDGYAEQLPPYSRYANGVPPKYSSGIGSVRRSAPPIPTDDSQETLNNSDTTSNTRHEAVAVNPFDDSATELNSATGTTVLPKDEGGSFKERVREKTKRKVCCGVLPCWLLGLIILAIIVAIFLGGIVGGVLAHKRGEEKGRQETSSTITVAGTGAAAPTTTVNTSNAPDVEPLSSTPSNLPTLPTGSYSVPLKNPSSISNSCLANNSQSDAWDCATGAELSINITSNNPQYPLVSLTYPTSPDAPNQYGAQPPQLSQPAPLILMENRDDPTRGPAYVFVQTYNKTVILREGDLPGGFSPPYKRSLLERLFFGDGAVNEPIPLHERDDSEWTSASFAQPTDKPWYCFWNGTILEGFIFVTQNANTSASSSTTSPGAAATSAGYSRTMNQPPRKRQASPSSLPYPNLIKIEERRSEHIPVQPYCQQMQILNNGLLGPVTDLAGKPIIVELTEVEPQLQRQAQAYPGGEGRASMMGPSLAAPTTDGLERRRLHGKRQVLTSCQCGWMSSS